MSLDSGDCSFRHKYECDEGVCETRAMLKDEKSAFLFVFGAITVAGDKLSI